MVIERWRETWPDLIRDLPDGTAIVPDEAGSGMLEWAMELGRDEAGDLLRAFVGESARIFVDMHPDATPAEFTAMVQHATLHGAIVIPGFTRAN